MTQSKVEKMIDDVRGELDDLWAELPASLSYEYAEKLERLIHRVDDLVFEAEGNCITARQYHELLSLARAKSTNPRAFDRFKNLM